MKFAPLIRDARQRALLSQSELAKAVGVSPRAIWLAEQGAGTLRTLVPVLEFLRIAIAGLPPASTLGARVRAARLRREMSLQDVAHECRVSIPTVRSLERGIGRIASLEAVIRVIAPSIRVRKPSKIRREAPRVITRAPVQKFINADCIDAMQTLPAGSVSLVVTSPPYWNAGKEYEADLSVQEYMQFAERWISSIPPLLAPNGALWLNVGHIMLSDTEAVPLTYLYYPLLVRHGLHLIQEVVWHARNGLSYSRRFAHRTERWMWCVKDPKNYVFNLDDVRDGTLNITDDPRNNPEGQNPTDYWHFPRVMGGRGASKEKTEHPCQFPVAMVERIIRACTISGPGDVVLDPFGGSGSTAVAAFLNNRSSISIEIDRRYHEIAKSRLEQTRRSFGTGRTASPLGEQPEPHKDAECKPQQPHHDPNSQSGHPDQCPEGMLQEPQDRQQYDRPPPKVVPGSDLSMNAD